MRVHSRSTRVTGVRVAASALAVLAFAGACGGSDSGSTNNNSSAPPAAAGTSSAPTSAAATTAPTSASAPAAATLMTAGGSHGTHLTDGSGRSVYVYSTDTSTTPMCTGACGQFWPPVTATGAPTAGTGVTGSMLGTVKNADGATQVTYGGHPLYYFAQDAAPGDTNGQGLDNGGKFWLVDPAGKIITK